ncbi:hypothetical protein AB0J38_28090 [Streptomyces sp. NPDC050095]|uniref:hypothetical protein n=1 Tax=unclassified Streptomyces TaxID=2593676 RepID=UPI00341DBCF5
MPTFLPAEFWWMFGQLLTVAMITLFVVISAAEALYEHLRHHRPPSEKPGASGRSAFTPGSGRSGDSRPLSRLTP